LVIIFLPLSSAKGLEMFKVQELTKTQSKFSERYLNEIEKWSLYFNSFDNPILSISRKGPRLLELLYEDNIISKSVLDRTCSEYSIPFLKNIYSLSVVDDSVLYGSTLNDMSDTIKSKLSLNDKKINIAPFRYSINAPATIQTLINKRYSIPINSDESPVHINLLIQSFKKLGKAYDLEFPILYLDGDFKDQKLFKETLKVICEQIGNAEFIVNNNIHYPDSYTILIKGENQRTEEGGPEFSKIRIFVRSDLEQITITPMSPCIISNEDIKFFDQSIDKEFQSLWTEVIGELSHRSLDEYDFRSLIVWANYLKSLSFLTKRLPFFEKYIQIERLELRIYDLQLLLGFSLSEKIYETLSKTILGKKKFVFFQQNPNNFKNVTEFKIPTSTEDGFFECNDNLNDLKFDSESEILNYFFHCQHTRLELSSRIGENHSSIKRLKFGFTLNYIVDLIKKNKPDTSITKIHFAFDKLIDLGSIVPKYLDLSLNPLSMIWGRVFRIGEGPLPTTQRILILLALIENLKKLYNRDYVPAVVLEKYTVIALTNSFNFKELNEFGITGLEIKKKYGLYGARSYVKTDPDGSGIFFLDWAKSLKFIHQNNDTEEYSINYTIAKNYDLNELAISTTAKDKLEDIAQFCYLVSFNSNENPLILLTTLTSKKEFWLAISTELHLWLSHISYNIYSCLHKLEEIRTAKEKLDPLLNSCNILLKNNANFTAQVAKKKDLFDSSDQIIGTIQDILVKYPQSTTNRVWRNMKDYLDLQKNEAVGNYNINEIITILRICHSINSICRALLNKAGFKLPEITKANSKSISEYLKLILETIENSKRNTFPIWHNFQNNDIQNKIRKILVTFDEQKSFNECFNEIRPILTKVSDTIQELFNIFGQPINSHEKITLPPPIYIVMWDVRNSVEVNDRTFLEQNVLLPIQNQIRSLLSPKKSEELVITLDDGGHFLSSNFSDVIMAFSVISKISKEMGVPLRVGCDVNYEGDLHIYPEKKIIGGRAYEYANRNTNFFKEIGMDNKRWTGTPIEEPQNTYLAIGEFAKRIAKENKEWNLASFDEVELDGLYTPRVKKGTCMPYNITLVVSNL
jgi:hypothetical protein